jgi:hypothetical protein
VINKTPVPSTSARNGRLAHTWKAYVGRALGAWIWPDAPAVNEIEENCAFGVTSRPFSVTGGLLREAVENVDELCQPPALLRLARSNPRWDACLDVMLEHCVADAIEGGLRGGKLLQDFEARPRLLQHATNAADLTFDAVEAGSEVLLQRDVQHAFLASSASALTLYASSSSRVDVRARTSNIAHTSSFLFASVTTCNRAASRSRPMRIELGLHGCDESTGTGDEWSNDEDAWISVVKARQVR